MIGKVGARWFAAVAMAVLLGWAAMGMATAQASNERMGQDEGFSEIRQVVTQLEQSLRFPTPIDVRYR
jgi:hypothetical protein